MASMSSGHKVRTIHRMLDCLRICLPHAWVASEKQGTQPLIWNGSAWYVVFPEAASLTQLLDAFDGARGPAGTCGEAGTGVVMEGLAEHRLRGCSITALYEPWRRGGGK